MTVDIRLVTRIAGDARDRVIREDIGPQDSRLGEQIVFPMRSLSRLLLSKAPLAVDSNPTQKSHYKDLAEQALVDWSLSSDWELASGRDFTGHRWIDGGWQPVTTTPNAYCFGLKRKVDDEYYAEPLRLSSVIALGADFWVSVQIR